MSRKFVLTPRQKAMWPILILGAFFEGFDDALINIALPYIKADFALSTQMSGYALSIIAFGTMVAFFVSRMADTIGRRKIFLSCVYMYSLCSFFTAFSPTIQVFIFFQFVARIFLIGCWSVGYVILCEEFSTEHRGKAVGRFQLTAVFGALLIGILLPVFTSVGLSWRALYVVGSLPMIPVFLMRNRLPETEAFLQVQEEKKQGKRLQKEDLFGPWRNPFAKYMVVMCLVWVFLYFGVKGTLNFFSLRVVNELSWTPNMVSLGLVLQTLTGIFVIAMNGKMMDVIGRKRAAAIIIVVGCVFSVLTFTLKSFYPVLVCSIISAGFVNSFLIVGSTLTNELFPTEIRANAMAWSNNIVGRLGQIIVPTAVTTMALWLGLGNAAAVAVALPLLSLILILIFLPETGKKNDTLVPPNPKVISK
ncbi:arabinose efflux permease family protein [Desulfitobacterium dehalogenans ATCC 51507]|uniref:Arabinose efflux permease family protein n=1 Tax=Desulfitobacterium dehalogenans (strain ATCC 51507 / DSM 9161 / JW/IU-DC1) TaxID=756499 RepID=I4A5L8_DESDJ|nr:MFS transporter [Desulfitobacterium dehalogenans]AFL99252.1 arabinose efflux permease family protein [Desulfitobacterium dehalogenans ATCC 51507]